MHLRLLNIVLALVSLGCLLFLQCCKDKETPSIPPVIKPPCKLEDVQPPVVIDCKLTKNFDSVKLLIQGTWVWLQEERVTLTQPLRYLTPKTEGVSYKVELKGDSTYGFQCDSLTGKAKFAILRLKEISGTSFPEDEDPVMVFYDVKTGARKGYVPIIICRDYYILQYQFVSSIIGPNTWKRVK